MVNLRICNNGSAEWGVFHLACWCRQQQCLALLLLTGYVTALISFWVSLSSSIPAFMIFQFFVPTFTSTSSILHAYVHVFSFSRLRSHLRSHLRSRLRSRLRSILRLRSRSILHVFIHVFNSSRLRSRLHQRLRSRSGSIPPPQNAKFWSWSNLRNHLGLGDCNTESPKKTRWKQRYFIVDWFFTSTFTSVFNSSRLRSRLLITCLVWGVANLEQESVVSDCYKGK